MCCAPGKECKAGSTTPSGTKKNLCKFFAEGRCREGTNCTYAHGEDEIGMPYQKDPSQLALQGAVGGKGFGGKGDMGGDMFSMGKGFMGKMMSMMAAWKGSKGGGKGGWGDASGGFDSGMGGGMCG